MRCDRKEALAGGVNFRNSTLLAMACDRSPACILRPHLVEPLVDAAAQVSQRLQDPLQLSLALNHIGPHTWWHFGLAKKLHSSLLVGIIRQHLQDKQER